MCLKSEGGSEHQRVSIFDEYGYDWERIIEEGPLSGRYLDYALIDSLIETVGDTRFRDQIEHILSIPKLDGPDSEAYYNLLTSFILAKQELGVHNACNFMNKMILMHILLYKLEDSTRIQFLSQFEGITNLEELLDFMLDFV
ncbi:PREDICTED: uncharacterized protein LOC108563876 [Nicrophorus vespilloides]|uniref:Uncharacterized protein LOC108563876 n=1 Tax=Nicrophorus vespilloides TaxID=110193 RepID=A0ABM1MUB8_NICVS|nr:PREDICTED: uncharacterized protein LOC108563876 [Nicrophorus vespilloides]